MKKVKIDLLRAGGGEATFRFTMRRHDRDRGTAEAVLTFEMKIDILECDPASREAVEAFAREGVEGCWHALGRMLSR